ncbi:MAG TPA: ABC transporter permease [Vicinamibacterales bacterium]|jgi:putative ABC transport system permease protein|nr:ABC transporter permease [Vicinamibacterales bacterium]
MSPIMTFRIAFKALNRNKMRTALTMLGMIIGVSAVITLVALGNGATSVIEDQIKAGGTNMITVQAGNNTQGGVRGGSGSSTTLTVEDANRIRNEVPGIQYVAVQVRNQQQVVNGNLNWFTRITGTDVDLPLIRSWTVADGSFFSPQDVTGATKVCVLGKTVNDQLFPDGYGTGQIIRVRNQPFRVIGVMSEKGASMNEDMDDQILAPYTTVQKRLIGQPNVQTITVSTASADDVSKVADDIALVLREAHKIVPGQEDDFFVRTLEEMADIRTQAMGTMTALLAGIAGVSLVVGGIGIMNIMLVSVTERTREIGLRMAIGAKGRDVLLQFLVEAIVLSLVGGGIGIALGFGLASAMQNWMQWPAKVPANAVLMSFGFAAATGVFFGFYPAQKAARLDPIDALRFE